MTYNQKMKCSYDLEAELWLQGYASIAGVDEVGRGPLAGPVVACACVLPRPQQPEDAFSSYFRSIQDSKSLTPKKRYEVYQALIANQNVHYALGIVDQITIDKINILQATLQAMQQAVHKLCCPPDFALIDGIDCPELSIPCRAVVKGDSLSKSIAAASIIAKVIRDQMMDLWDEQYPQYGFKDHKGYGTQAHLQAIKEHGPCPLHRMSFAPIKTVR